MARRKTEKVVLHPETGEPLPFYTEAKLLSYVKRQAKLFGWKCYHTRFSVGSEKGYPDIHLVKKLTREEKKAGKRGVMIYAELKDEDREPTSEQKEWLSDLWACRGPHLEVYLWRPRDYKFIEERLSRDYCQSTLTY